MKLGYRIYAQMKKMGLTQSELVKKSGLSQQIISNYINNKAKPGYDAILALSKALEVEPAWFFDESVLARNIIAFGTAQQGGTLKIGHLSPIKYLPSPVSLDKNAMGIVMNFYWLIFDKLVNFYTRTGTEGRIAYNWKKSGKYCIFSLYECIIFHDGGLCTAADVKYSYQKWIQQNKENNPIQTIQVLDNRTLLLELKYKCQISEIPMPFIVPKGTLEKTGKFVGTGPFKAVEIQPDYWHLKTHRAYHRGEPFIDEIVIRRYNNQTDLENALKREEINLAIGVDIKDKRFKVQTEAGVQRYELVFRLDSALCSDLHFRKAIYYGLDRTAIAKAAGLKNPLFAKGPFDYVLNERSETVTRPDIKKAKQLLSEISDMNDKRLTIEISSVNPKEEKIVREISTQLNSLSIKTEIVESQAQAAVVLFNTESPILERNIWQKEGIANVTGYYNSQVEKLLSELTNFSTDTEILKQIQILIMKDYPSIPLFYDETPITYVKNLRALENRMILMTMLDDIHTWYFESDERIMSIYG